MNFAFDVHILLLHLFYEMPKSFLVPCFTKCLIIVALPCECLWHLLGWYCNLTREVGFNMNLPGLYIHDILARCALTFTIPGFNGRCGREYGGGGGGTFVICLLYVVNILFKHSVTISWSVAYRKDFGWKRHPNRWHFFYFNLKKSLQTTKP